MGKSKFAAAANPYFFTRRALGAIQKKTKKIKLLEIVNLTTFIFLFIFSTKIFSKFFSWEKLENFPGKIEKAAGANLTFLYDKNTPVANLHFSFFTPGYFLLAAKEMKDMPDDVLHHVLLFAMVDRKALFALLRVNRQWTRLLQGSNHLVCCMWNPTEEEAIQCLYAHMDRMEKGFRTIVSRAMERPHTVDLVVVGKRPRDLAKLADDVATQWQVFFDINPIGTEVRQCIEEFARRLNEIDPVDPMEIPWQTVHGSLEGLRASLGDHVDTKMVQFCKSDSLPWAMDLDGPDLLHLAVSCTTPIFFSCWLIGSLIVYFRLYGARGTFVRLNWLHGSASLCNAFHSFAWVRWTTLSFVMLHSAIILVHLPRGFLHPKSMIRLYNRSGIWVELVHKQLARALCAMAILSVSCCCCASLWLFEE